MGQPAERQPRWRLLVIYNPTAGQRRIRRYRRVMALLRERGCQLDVRATAAHGDAERLARAARGGAYDAVVAAGGDGTVNEAINGLLGSPLPLALLPLGTANVLAAEIGLSPAPEVVARTIVGGPARAIAAGRANGRAFAMMVGVGHDAHAVRDVSLGLKRLTGKGAYVWAAVREALAGRRVLYEVTVDGASYQAGSVIVCKGRKYAGNFVIAPEARLEAPTFEVCMVARAGRWPTVRYGIALVLGLLPRLRDYRVVTGRRVTVTGPAGEPVQSDGDVLTALPLTVEIDPAPLNLVMPK